MEVLIITDMSSHNMIVCSLAMLMSCMPSSLIIVRVSLNRIQRACRFGRTLCHKFAHDRARPCTFAICPMRCALRIGLYRGCLVAVSGGCVVSDALCRGDWWWACRVRCA